MSKAICDTKEKWKKGLTMMLTKLMCKNIGHKQILLKSNNKYHKPKIHKATKLTMQFCQHLENLYLLAHFGVIENPISNLDEYFNNFDS